MELITCRSCKLLKTSDLFRQLNGKRRDDLCKKCHSDRCRERSKERKREIRSDPLLKEKENSRRREIENLRYKTDPKFAESKRMSSKKYYNKIISENGDKAKAYKERQRLFSLMNRDYFNSKTIEYNQRKKQATVPFSELDLIKEFYDNTPDGYVVDHIIPFKNNLVCGLHVRSNLQYITKSENSKKGNLFSSDLYEKWMLCNDGTPLLFNDLRLKILPEC